MIKLNKHGLGGKFMAYKEGIFQIIRNQRYFNGVKPSSGLITKLYGWK